MKSKALTSQANGKDICQRCERRPSKSAGCPTECSDCDLSLYIATRVPMSKNLDEWTSERVVEYLLGKAGK